MSKQLKADLSLLMVTLIWGSSFVLSKNSLDHVATFNFLAIRFILAAFLSGIIFHKNVMNLEKNTIKYGILIGIILFAAYALQTVGLNYTSASKSGFITGFSVIIVPVLSALLLKQKPHRTAIIGVILAMIGLSFLSLDSSLTLNIGDLFTFFSAIFAYILAGEKLNSRGVLGSGLILFGMIVSELDWKTILSKNRPSDDLSDGLM